MVVQSFFFSGIYIFTFIRKCPHAFWGQCGYVNSELEALNCLQLHQRLVLCYFRGRDVSDISAGFSPARCHWSVFLMLLVYKSTTFPYTKCSFRKATEARGEARERRTEVSGCQSDHVFPTSSRRRAVKPNAEEKMSQERQMCLCHVCYEQSSHLVVTLWTVTAGERDQEIERGNEWRVGCG